MLDFPQVEEILTAIAQERPTVVQLDIGDGWLLRREYEEVYIGPAIPGIDRFCV